jgi:hypothetical protein
MEHCFKLIDIPVKLPATHSHPIVFKVEERTNE